MSDLVIHESHRPEDDDPQKRFFPNLVYCTRCCRLVRGDQRGVTETGAAACPGPVRIELRREVVTWPAGSPAPASE